MDVLVPQSMKNVAKYDNSCDTQNSRDPLKFRTHESFFFYLNQKKKEFIHSVFFYF